MSRIRITPQERTAALSAALETLKVITRILEVEADDEPTAATPQEQEILDLFHDLEEGSRLTTTTISKMLGNFSDNGTLKKRLAEMVKKGLLHNHNPGYSPTQ